MIRNGDQLFSDSKLKMMSEIYEANSWVEIFGCGRGRAVKGSISKKPQIPAHWFESTRLSGLVSLSTNNSFFSFFVLK